MTEREEVFRWVLAGKQVGVRASFELCGEVIWTSVGIQSWSERFRVYVDEIKESQMDAEEYSREEVRDFASVEEAAQYIDEHTRVTFEQLRPCKGQKIFNPGLSAP